MKTLKEIFENVVSPFKENPIYYIYIVAAILTAWVLTVQLIIFYKCYRDSYFSHKYIKVFAEKKKNDLADDILGIDNKIEYRENFNRTLIRAMLGGTVIELILIALYFIVRIFCSYVIHTDISEYINFDFILSLWKPLAVLFFTYMVSRLFFNRFISIFILSVEIKHVDFMYNLLGWRVGPFTRTAFLNGCMITAGILAGMTIIFYLINFIKIFPAGYKEFSYNRKHYKGIFFVRKC